MKINDKPKLILIDSHALIHRAYHALPPMTNKKGEALNAVYGYTSVLLKILKEMKPQYIVAAFDLPQPTFRHKEFKEYKAHRPKAPEDLIGQFNKAKEIVRAFGIPVMEMPGFEADDILGTICEKVNPPTGGLKLKVKSIVLTGDLDALQLVDDEKTVVYTLKKGITDTVIYDEKAVMERFGFSPLQLVDFKALKGDPSDNIPGVPGIGDKTASALVAKYGTLEKIYDEIEKRKSSPKRLLFRPPVGGLADRNLSERGFVRVDKSAGGKGEVLSEKLIEKLIDNKERAFLSKKLATIRRDAPIDFDIERCRVGGYDKEKIEKLFDEMEFYSLKNRLPWNSAAQSAAENQNVKIKNQNDILKIKNGTQEIENEKDIKNLIDRIINLKEKQIAVLLKENGEAGKHSITIVLFEESGEVESPVEIQPQNIGELKEILEDEKIKKIGYNLKALIKILYWENGIKLQGAEFDVLLAKYVLNPGSVILNGAKRSEGSPRSFATAQDDTRFSQDDSKNLQDDDINLFGLKVELEKEIEAQGLKKIFYEIEMPLLPILAQMEIAGIKLDSEYLKKFSGVLAEKLEKLEKDIYKLAGEKFNINSPKQISQTLFNKLKIETKGLRKTPGGKISTGASELEKLRGAHPIADLILSYREIFKLKSTYVDALPQMVAPDGRIHTNYNQTSTSTGRLSSLEPNLQNIPIKTEVGASIRKAFVADKGYQFVAFDYSQIELRLASVIAPDEKMKTAFREGKDIHQMTASEIFNTSPEKVDDKMRRMAKTLNFGVLYGMSAKSFAETAKIDYVDAKKFIKEYFSDFSGIAGYIENIIAKARETGYVETLFGRKRYIPEILSGSWQVKQAAERMAANMPIQGTAADIIKMAMIKLWHALDLASRDDVRLLLQIHDELVFEIKEDIIKKEAEKIKNIMENVVELDVPLEVGVEYGDNLREMVLL